MRWLVLGAGGQVGSALHTRLEGDAGHEVMALPRGRLDLCDADAVERALEAARPEVVVNAAAFTDVDGCERDEQRAFAVNAEAPGTLARLCSAGGARLVQLSTDYVFDGEAEAPYTEDAATGPIQVYGRSKLAGEQAVAAEQPEAIVARTAWVLGNGANFVRAILRRAASGGALRVVSDQWGSPTRAPDLAGALVALVEQGGAGLYHLANAGIASRFELARAALEIAGLAKVPITPIQSADWPTPARRPLYTPLACPRAAGLGVRLRPWREALGAHLAEEGAPPPGAGGTE